MGKRLVIQLEVCRDCEECTATCSYPYHEANSGVARLLELVAQELACRRCEEPSCVVACPNEALEQQADGIIRRYNMRCTGCLSCSLACPFGNIIPAALQFRDSMCDFCAGRPDQTPECVRSCPLHAITIEEVPPGQPDVHVLGENLAVKSILWQKVES